MDKFLFFIMVFQLTSSFVAATVIVLRYFKKISAMGRINVLIGNILMFLLGDTIELGFLVHKHATSWYHWLLPVVWTIFLISYLMERDALKLLEEEGR